MILRFSGWHLPHLCFFFVSNNDIYKYLFVKKVMNMLFIILFVDRIVPKCYFFFDIKEVENYAGWNLPWVF